jgi:hypothetical protein
MPPNSKSPSFQPGRSAFSGSMGVSGSLFVSGSLTVNGTTTLSGSTIIIGPLSGSSGSYVMGPASSAQHAIAKWDNTNGTLLTGSNVIFADDGPYLYLSGSNQMMMGLPLSGSTGSWGIGTGYMAPTGSFVIYSSEMEGANRVAVRILSNPMKTTIDPDMIITQFGWLMSGSSGCEVSASWNLKVDSFEATELSAAEVVGTEVDGASSIGAILGTSASYVTAGSKLVSVMNNATEREFIDYAGQKTYGISDYGSSISDYYFTELISITGSLINLYPTVNQVPAGALIQGVSVRVRNTFPTASVFACGLSGSWNDWGASISGVQTVTNSTSSLSAGWKFVSVNSPIFLSCSVMQANVSPSSNSGSVRVECRYRTLNPLTS